MGHEAFGRIDAVGAGVPQDRIGSMVVIEPNVPCLACDACRRGWTSACSSRQSVGMNRQGSLAELLVVPDAFAWSLDGEPEDLVCVEPTTVVMAALRRLGMVPSQALVVGAGAQGLLMTLLLLERGVEVVAHDVNAERMAFAAGLGAVPASDDADRRFPLVIDTVGSSATMAYALERVEVAGTILVLGLDSRPMDITAQALVRRQALIRGSLTYDHPIDFRTSVDLMATGGFKPGRIMTAVHDLGDVQAAFERSSSIAGKTWIRVARPPEKS
jgi:alcohol dehydrogenase/L-iditol 2-dehydrogenase